MSLAEFHRDHNRVHYKCFLDGEEWAVVRFELYEALNTPGYLKVSLISPRANKVYLDYCIGCTATFQMPVGTLDGYRYYHGIVRESILAGGGGAATYYDVVIVPRIWQLEMTHRSRVHVTDRSQGIDTVGLIRSLMDDHGLGDAVTIHQRKNTDVKFSFLTQYDESDLNFLHRIIEERGFGYYVTDQNGKDHYHFFDTNDPLPRCRPFDEVLFRRSSGYLMDQYESIEEMKLRSSMRYGFVDTRSYDFKYALRRAGCRTQIDGRASFEHFEDRNECYEYPYGHEEQASAGGQAAGQTYLRRDEYNLRSWITSGRGNYRSMRPGHRFRAANAADHAFGEEYICLSATHIGEELSHVDADGAPMGMGGIGYSMTFTAFSPEFPYVPSRVARRPAVKGCQTAIVVGPPGEEIHTDEYGRIKVHMHWDRQPKFDFAKSGAPKPHDYDDTSSFWIRVSQQAAGRGWGIFSLPRVGQEVLIDFVEGDPDQPIVTGVMHNDYQRTPYLLPNHKTRTVIKTNSTPGGQGFNEIRFEDKKGHEQIFIHAERNEDVRVKACCMETIGGARHLLVGDDLREKIGKDKHIQVEGEQHETIGKDFHVKVDGLYNLRCEKTRMSKMGLSDGLDVGHNYIRRIGADEIAEIHGTLGVQVQGQWLQEVAQKIQLETKANAIVQAGQSICINGPGGFIKIDAGGITIQGKMVKINSGGAAEIAKSFQIPEYPETPTPQPKDPIAAANSITGEKSLLPASPD